LVAARALPDAPRPLLASAPSSLTQQFFAEGEQLEMAHQAGQITDAGSIAVADDEGQLEILSRIHETRRFAGSLGALGLRVCNGTSLEEG
jgi:hypothetical protein